MKMDNNINETYKLNINTKKKEGNVINYEKLKLYEKVFIKDYNDDNMSTRKNIEFIKINKENKNEVNNVISELHLQGINIDLSEIMFDKLMKLNMKKSICYINKKDIDIQIEQDYKSIISFLQYYTTNNISINKLILIISNENSEPINLAQLLNYITKLHSQYISITINNSIVKLTYSLQEKTFPNIYSFSLFPINKLNSNIFTHLIPLMPNLNKVEFNIDKISKDDYNTITLCSNIKYIKCISDNEMSLNENTITKKCINLINYDNPNFDFNVYSINLLESITLPLFEYKQQDKTIVLYGEANLEFYNDNNLNFIINVIKSISNEKLNKVKLCNFDIENIDYLADLLSRVDNLITNELFIDNLNISENFVNILNTSSFFKADNIYINNLLFLSQSIESNFYKAVHCYSHKITKLCLQNLENINKYENILLASSNLKSLELSDIYEMDIKMLSSILEHNKNIQELKLINIDLNPNGEDNELEINKQQFLDIVTMTAKQIKSLTIQGSEDYNFILDNINTFSFDALTNLSIIIEDINQNDLIETIISKLNAPNLSVLKCNLYTISNTNLQKLFKSFPLLYKIK